MPCLPEPETPLPEEVRAGPQEEWLRAAKGAKNEEGLIDKVIEEETLWSCTACLSCQVNCPVSIPTFDKNIEMRRYLTMTLSKMSPEVKLLYKNLKTIRPYGMGKAQRLEWTEGLDVKKATEQEVEVLYWVGCVASLDDRNRKIARSVAKILNKAGVSFGVLGPDEKCCGDPLRRTGNEYQYQEMAQGNVDLIKELGVKKIVTACPHCFNTLKNDYAQLGAEFDVYHHTEFIYMLAKEGKISLNPRRWRRHVSRPVLSRQGQQGIRCPPADHGPGEEGPFRGAAEAQGRGLLLRRRRRQDLDGRASRPDLPPQDGRGHRHIRQDRGYRVPLLSDNDGRRNQGQGKIRIHEGPRHLRGRCWRNVGKKRGLTRVRGWFLLSIPSSRAFRRRK